MARPGGRALREKISVSGVQGRQEHGPGRLLSAFGRFTFSPSPTVLKKTFRNWVGEALGPPVRIRTGGVGSANPGAVRKPQQNQILHTQGPVARKKTQAITPDFARRNHGSTNQEGAPRKKGSGESGPMDLGGAQRSRSPLAASPGAFWLLCRHGQSNSPPAGGEISSADNEPNPNPAPSSVTASPCHLSLSPLSLRDISP